MKKIFLSLAVLAALSTASFAAGNRSWDLQDTEYYNSAGKSVIGQAFAHAASPLAIAGPTSNFERLNMNSATNELASH